MSTHIRHVDGALGTLSQRLGPYAAIARPQFLVLPLTLVVLGATASAVDGTFDLLRSFLALFGLLAAHVAVNALNEASDAARGIDDRTDPTPFSGGTKTITEGELSVSQARRFGLAAGAVATVVGLWFVWVVGVAIVPLVVAGAVFVVGYTDVFARVALGELVAGLGLGGLPVLGVALVQSGAVGPVAIAVAIPASLLTACLLLLNEFPDEEPDRIGGRRNIVLVFGRRRGAWAYVLLALGVPTTIAALALTGEIPLPALLGVVPSLLLARPLSWALNCPEKSVPVPALRRNVSWVLATNVAMAVGLLVA